MPSYNGKSFSSTRNINLQGGAGGTGLLRWSPPVSGVPALWSSNPFSTDDYGLYLNASGQLVFSALGSTTVLGSGGGSGGVPSWETLFAADTVFTITPDQTFTIGGNRSTATNVLTLSNIGGGSGAVLAFSNSGSGMDVLGTSSTWQVTKAGVATLAGVIISGTSAALSTTGAAVWTIKDNDASALSIDASGTTGIILIDSTNGSEVVKFGKSIQVTDGNATFISTSNTVSNILVTNNTATTFGADADSSGVVVFRSTSLTTGSLLQLQLTEGTLNGGFYLTARDVTGGANVYTVGENGVTVLAGTAGSDSFTMTAGDLQIGDGSVNIVDADNAFSLKVTNNTATSASVAVIAGSGVFTGTTTTSFVTITPSGLTTGTAVYLPVAGMTSGTALSIVAATANFTTGGKLISLDATAAVAGNLLSAVTTGVYTGTGMIIVSAGAMTTGVMLSLTSTTGLTSGSLIRATTSTAGAIATNGAISFSATGNFTSTSRIGFLNVAANTTTGGVVAHISATALTDGTILALDAVEATLTTGKYIDCYDGAASDFSVSKYGATVIAGSAAGTASLTQTAGDHVLTSGHVVLTSGTIKAAPQAIVSANTAISVVTLATTINTTGGATTHTMADGAAGQIKTISCITYAGDAVITPTNLAAGTTITLNAAGDSWTGVFYGTEWFTIALSGTAAVA